MLFPVISVNAIARPDTATNIEAVSMMPPGLSAATKPSGMPSTIANSIALKISFRVGHMRLAIIEVTGSRVRKEVPRSPRRTSWE